MNNDLISRSKFCAFLREVSTRQHYETLLTKKDKYPTVADVIEEICCELDGTALNGFDNAPTVEQPTGKWISVKYRPLNVDERIRFADHYGIEYSDTIDEKAFDCPMPEDGREILISTAWGVRADVACNDVDGEGFVCYGLEDNDDWDGVDAWMPMPEPYKKGEEA